MITIPIASIMFPADLSPTRHSAPAVLYPVALWPAIPAWKRLFWSRDVRRELDLDGLTAGQIGPLAVFDTRALRTAVEGAVVGAWVPAELWCAWASLGWGYVVAQRRDHPLVVLGENVAFGRIDNGRMAEILNTRQFPHAHDPKHCAPGSPAMQHKLKVEADKHKAEVAAARARMRRGY